MVELVVVMAIIAILAGIGAGAYSYTMNKIKVSRTEALIKRIEASLVAVKEKHGFYPQTFDQECPVFLLELDSQSADVNNDGAEFGSRLLSVSYPKGYFTEYKRIVEFEGLRKQAKPGYFNPDDKFPVVLDSWGNPLYYVCPGKKNPDSFDLYSAGPDGKVGDTGKALWTKVNPGDPENLRVKITSGIEVNNVPKFDTVNSDDIGR